MLRVILVNTIAVTLTLGDKLLINLIAAVSYVCACVHCVHSYTCVCACACVRIYVRAWVFVCARVHLSACADLCPACVCL